MYRQMQSHHRERETDVTRYLRRKLRDPHIGSIFNLKHGSLMLIKWINKRHRLFQEVGVIERNATPRDVADTVKRVMTMESPHARRLIRETVSSMRAADLEENADAQEQADRHLAAREYLRRKALIHYRDHPVWRML